MLITLNSKLQRISFSSLLLVVMLKCARPICVKTGINRCSICLRETYCSGECQKGDWKGHKLICKTIKKFSNQLQPYYEAFKVISEILETAENADKQSRVLTHLIAYSLHQFDDRISGKFYRERGNAELISNCKVEIDDFHQIYLRLVNNVCDEQDKLCQYDDAIFTKED